MKKRLGSLLIVFALALAFVSGSFAEIIPPEGPVEYAKGKFSTKCVVLCETLSVRDGPSFGAAVVDSWRYGTVFHTTETEGDWVNFLVSEDGGLYHWARSEYVLVDPAYYVTEAETPIYAYEGEGAPRVALLKEGQYLPILKETDGGYIVSLRAAAGFIPK